MQQHDSELKIAVIFATTGRRDILEKTVSLLSEQSRLPDKIVISCHRQSDSVGIRSMCDINIIYSDLGLTKQRNLALQHVRDNFDILIFFDDDFIPHRLWIQNVEKLFILRPDVASVTGYIIADGIKGPGINFDDGLRLACSWTPPTADRIEKNRSPYGCNMAFRYSAVKDLRFDEKLPLYGWQEDRDFGAAVAARGGSLVMLSSAGGVHLGVKSGRTSGVRLGYSQVINPVYLYNKNSMTLFACANHIGRNIISNMIFYFFPESYIDRAGRLRGNIIGIKDVLSGKIDPEIAATLS